MSESREKNNWLASTGPGTLYVLALGFMVGLALAGDIFEASTQALVTAFLLGVVAAYLFLQWVDLVTQSLPFYADVIPDDLSLADREAVRQHAEILDGYQVLLTRTRHLLQSWSQGWGPAQVMQLAQFQSARLKTSLWAGALFCIILLVPCFWINLRPQLTIGLAAWFAVTVLARRCFLSRVDYFIESQILNRLPGNLPGTQLSAHDIGDAISASLDKAFNQLTSLSSTSYAESAGRIETALTAHVENLQATNHDLANKLQQVMSADHLKEALNSHIDRMENASEGLASKLGSVMGGDDIQHALQNHVDQLQVTNSALATQLSGIMSLGKDIEKVFHLQEMVDGAIKSASAAEEFSALVVALKQHLEQSDKLLTEAAKPRTIRLVETEGEITAS